MSSSSNSYGAGNNRGETVVVDMGHRTKSCGYCKSGGSRTSISHGLLAHSLTVDDYQALLDRGWRRSGCLLYKPEMESSCCPPYTIRLNANKFVPSKEQCQVLKRMQRFLDGSSAKRSDELMRATNTSIVSRISSFSESPHPAAEKYLSGNLEEKDRTEPFIACIEDQIHNAVKACIKNRELSTDIQFPKASVKKVQPAKRKLLAEGSDDLLFTSSFSFQIAAALRRCRKEVPVEKSSESGAEESKIFVDNPKVIAEKLVSHINSFAESLGLLVRACNGHINFYSSERQVGEDGVASIVHESKKSSPASSSKESCSTSIHQNPEAKRLKLEVHLKRSTFDPEEYSLYRKYQLRVHNDSPDRITESSYRRFLVDTPLIHVPPTGDVTVPPCGFGSFHQQYLIDGRLVAVGVVDILPNCLSSKYLFWDPDHAFLSLGKYSALQEIRWVTENQVHCPSLQYYYLGYYIHSCSKMRYKAAYWPSELLCPLRYQWVPFDAVKELLDRKSYVVLSDYPTQNGEPPRFLETNEHLQGSDDVFHVNMDEEMVVLNSEDSDDELDLESNDIQLSGNEDGGAGNVLIGLGEARLRYKDLRQAFGSRERQLMETQLCRYMRVVGTELSDRMVYSLG